MYSAVLTYKGKKHGKIRVKSHEFLAVLYEKLGFYKKAADSYLAFAKNDPSHPKSSDFFYNAGVIFDALNDVGRAIYSYKRYFDLSKKQDRHEIFYFIGLMFQENRNWNKAINYYQRYLKSSSSNKLRLMRASFLIADIYEKKLKKLDQAKIWHQKTLGLYRRINAGVSYGSRSHFYIVEQSYYKNFSKVKIPSDSKKQKLAVTRKIKFLNKLERALKPIIRYDDGEQIIASLCLIGQANQEMAKAIYQAPVPKALDKKGRAQYKLSIKKIIEPYVKQSIRHYQLALNKASALEVYSDWVGKAYKGLGSIQLVKGQFKSFLKPPVDQEIFKLHIPDITGTVTEGLLKTLTQSLQSGLSRSAFENLAQAISSKEEDLVLNAVSIILNKDPDNVLAMNSLAFYYLQTRRWGLASLILNRISSNKDSARIMNNLAVIYLRYGHVREAFNYLKKALAIDNSHSIARVNLANIFIRQHDYKNAYRYYDDSYSTVLKAWPSRDSRVISILSNYGVSLTGTKQWKSGLFVFKNLNSNPSPSNKVLFNYAVFLTEKSRREKKEKAKTSLMEAKELVDELKLSTDSAYLKRKLRLLSESISVKLKELQLVSLNFDQLKLGGL